MVNGLWGKKVGMTQVFSAKDKVVPVTVIDVARWVVTQLKTVERDGYNAVQIGLVKEKYAEQAFDVAWLKKQAIYFSVLREVAIKADDSQQFTVGQQADFSSILKAGDFVDVAAKTIGRGFQGVVKRHNFAGGGASHGSKFGRIPGTLSFMRSRGRVIKGKRMPGNYGNELKMLKKLEVIRIENESNLVLIKGSVPGKTGSLVFIRKV